MQRGLRFSANLSLMFAELPFLDRFGAAASARFAAVECQFPYAHAVQEIAARVDGLGLVMNSLNTPPGDTTKNEFGFAAVPGRADDFKTGLTQALRYADIIGVPAVHCMAGFVADAERGCARETFLANLAFASEQARSAGVTLLIEPLNAVDRPAYFLSRSDDAVALIDELGCDNVKLLFDVYHVQIMEGDLIRRLDRHWPRIGHVQIASLPLRREPDEGEVAYPVILAEIARRGFAGWIGCEYHPRGRTEDGLGWRAAFGYA